MARSQKSKRGEEDDGVLSIVKKLLRSTGHKAWYVGTSVLVIFVPLVIALELEQGFDKLDIQHEILGTQRI